MPRLRVSGPFLFFLVLLSVLLAVVQVGAVTLAADKLGLSAQSAFLLLGASLFGSVFNVPALMVGADGQFAPISQERWKASWRAVSQARTGDTIVAVNIGGCLVPLAFSGYLLLATPVSGVEALLGAAVVAVLARVTSRPIAGVGIAMPMLVAPLSAVATAWIINPAYSAPLAYIAGTVGVLVGADLWRLRDVHRLGAPVASIGGAGSFDGIFITGILSVLLA